MPAAFGLTVKTAPRHGAVKIVDWVHILNRRVRAEAHMNAEFLHRAESIGRRGQCCADAGVDDLRVIVQEDGLHRGQDVVLREAFNERSVGNLHVIDGQTIGILSLGADGVIGIEHAFNCRVADRMNDHRTLVINGFVHQALKLIHSECGDAAGRRIIMVGAAHQCSACAKTAVNEELQRSEAVHGRALTGNMAGRKEFAVFVKVLEARLMIDARDGMIRFNAVVRFKHGGPAARAQIAGLH